VRSIKASVNVDLTLLVIEVIVFLIPGIVGHRDGGSGNSPTEAAHENAALPHDKTRSGQTTQPNRSNE
jgi:hypothetical protein